MKQNERQFQKLSFEQNIYYFIFKQLTVELGLLEGLDLADEDVVEWVDGVGGLLNVLGDGVGDQFLHERLEVAGANLAVDDLHHLGADLAFLCVKL